MADKNTLGYAADPINPLFVNGAVKRVVLAQMNVAIADDPGDVHILARGLPISVIVGGITLKTPLAAIAGLSDVDIGFRRQDNAVVLDKDVLVDGADLSGGLTGDRDLTLVAAGVGTKRQTIGDMLSLQPETAPSGGVDLIATVNSDPSAAGVVTLEIELFFPA